MADTRPSTPLSFSDLGVPAALVSVLTEAGITAPFPIQTATLPDSLKGRDVLGRGRTGSGKTYAFVLPLLARLAEGRGKRQPGRPRALVLAPTRELASQIEAAMAPLAQAMNLRTITIFGGVRPNPQIQGLRNGVDIVIACPGRLADHVQSGHCDLGSIEITVLDEADHMADLGFLPVVRRLLDKTPAHSQRLLFSATLDAGVDVLVKRFLHDPVTHRVDSAAVAGRQHDAPRVARQQGGPRARPRRPDRGTGHDDRVHPHQARRQDAGPPAQRRAASPPWSCTATCRRTPAAQPRPRSAPAPRGCSSPPTSPPAASTSTTSAWSCTSTRRSSTRPTCTAPAARPAPAPRAPSSR